jgi:hypothetical protein
MKVAYATNLVIILWLLLATPYCKKSHSVTSHNPWKCNVCFCYNTKVTQISITSNIITLDCTKGSRQYACLKFFLASFPYTLLSHKRKGDEYNVHFCFNKSKHYISNKYNSYRKQHNLYSYLSNKPQNSHNKYSFSTTNHHLGPSIKWWEDVGDETKRNNDMLNASHKPVNIFSKLYSKNSMHALYRFKPMAEASSTKNMNVCIVVENEITNNSQKKNHLRPCNHYSEKNKE